MNAGIDKSTNAHAGFARAACEVKTLRGIVPPMITPLLGSDELDHAGVERLVHHMLEGGVHGLFILGTSGEAPSLSYRLRRELITRVCREVNNRIPVLVGITDTASVEMLNLANHAADAGVRAVVLSAPYYFPLSQTELLGYVERLLPRLPLPLFLYNMPMMTKLEFGHEMLARLAQHPGVLGVKDSSGRLEYIDQALALKRQREDWKVFVGPEHLLLETLRRGGDGGVSGGANFWPELFVELFGAFSAGEMQRANGLQEQLLRLGPLYSVGKEASSVVKGMKCACGSLGLCRDTAAEPFQRFEGAEREQVRKILREAGLPVLPGDLGGGI